MPRSKRFCTIDDCDQPRVGRGWCGRHYQRWYATGSTDEPIRIDEGWPEGMKPCSGCREMKPLDDFFRATRGRSGRQSQCRDCMSAARKRWAKGAKYGLADGEYEAMFEKQGGLCAACGKPPTAGQRLCIDHEHDTGRVRGLLCHSCNLGIGSLGDSVEGVAAALAYLVASSVLENDDLLAAV